MRTIDRCLAGTVCAYLGWGRLHSFPMPPWLAGMLLRIGAAGTRSDRSDTILRRLYQNRFVVWLRSCSSPRSQALREILLQCGIADYQSVRGRGPFAESSLPPLTFGSSSRYSYLADILLQVQNEEWFSFERAALLERNASSGRHFSRILYFLSDSGLLDEALFDLMIAHALFSESIANGLRVIRTAGLLHVQNRERIERFFQAGENVRFLLEALLRLSQENYLLEENFDHLLRAGQYALTVSEAILCLRNSKLPLDRSTRQRIYQESRYAEDLSRAFCRLFNHNLLTEFYQQQLLLHRQYASQLALAIVRLQAFSILNQVNFQVIARHPEFSLHLSLGLWYLHRSGIENEANREVLVQNAEQSNILALGFELLHQDGLFTQPNRSLLIRQPAHAYDLAQAINALNGNQILTQATLDLLEGYPEGAVMLAQICHRLHLSNLLNGENLLALSQNTAQLVSFFNVFNFLTALGMMTQGNVNRLFQRVEHLQNLVNSMRGLALLNIFNQQYFNLLVDNSVHALVLSEAISILARQELLNARNLQRLTLGQCFHVYPFLREMGRNPGLRLTQGEFHRIMESITMEGWNALLGLRGPREDGRRFAPILLAAIIDWLVPQYIDNYPFDRSKSINWIFKKKDN